MGKKYKVEVDYFKIVVTVLVVAMVFLMAYTPYYLVTTVVPLGHEQQIAQNDMFAAGNTNNVTEMNMDINTAIKMLNDIDKVNSPWFGGYEDYAHQLQLELKYTNTTHKQVNVLQTYQSFINNNAVECIYIAYGMVSVPEYFFFSLVLFLFILDVRDEGKNWFKYVTIRKRRY